MQLKIPEKLWSKSRQKKPRKVGLGKACRVWQQTAVITGVACNPVIFSCVHALVTCPSLWILLHFFFVFQIIVHFSFFHLNKIYQISYVPVASQNHCVKTVYEDK